MNILTVFVTGFFISFSLILAIGSQNAFVLRQGLTGRFVAPVVLFCAVSDAVLICAGVFGFSHIISPLFDQYRDVIFGLAASWLGGYGLLRIRSAVQASTQMDIPKDASQGSVQPLRTVLISVALMTWLNPHVYLDTVVLMGTLSLSYPLAGKIAFACGASLASFCFFMMLGFGAKLVSPYMVHPRSWQIVDGLTAFVMLLFASLMASQISLFSS